MESLENLILEKKVASDPEINLEKIRNLSLISSNTVREINSKLSAWDANNSMTGLFLNDTLLKIELQNILDNLDLCAQQMDSMKHNVNSFSKNLNNGEGVISYALKDSYFVHHLKYSIRNFDEASYRFNENRKALKYNFFFSGLFQNDGKGKEKGTLSKSQIII